MSLFGNKEENGIPADMRKFLNDTINKAGYASISGAKREEYLQEFYRYLDDDIVRRAIASLSDSAVAAFEALLKRNPPPTPTQAQDFLRKHDPQYKQHVKDAKDLTMAYSIRYLRANANR